MNQNIPNTDIRKSAIFIKRIVVVTLTVVVTIMVIAYPIWWRMTKLVEAKNQEIDSLQKEANRLTEKLNSFSQEE